MENIRIRQLLNRRRGLKQKLWEEYFLFKHRRTTILRAGPTWYGGGSGDFSARSPYSLTQEQQNQLKRELEELDIPMVKYSVTTNPNGADVAMDGPWAGLRSGLSLGFKF